MNILRRTLLSLALTAGIVFAPCVSAQQVGVPPTTGHSAPDFTLQSVDAKAINLGQLRGKVVVIHFAATWCPFCNAEAPNLEKLYQRYKDKGVQVLIIDIKETRVSVEKMARKFGFSFPVLLDTDGSVATSYAPPKTVLPDLARDEVMIASNLIIDRQ